MAKIIYDPSIQQVRGTIAGMTYKKSGGQLLITKRAIATEKPPTSDQIAVRERWKAAVTTSKAALTDPVKRAFYEQMTDGVPQRIFSVAMADFLIGPAVDVLDVTGYHGHVGDTIKMTARDDLGVVSVSVEIKSAAGVSLEKGQAVQSGTDWVYHATTAVAAGTSVTIFATATDHAGQAGQRGTTATV